MEPAPEKLKPAPKPANAATVLPVITENYGTYHIVRERLTALQKWVREQFETTNGEKLGR